MGSKFPTNQPLKRGRGNPGYIYLPTKNCFLLWVYDDLISAPDENRPRTLASFIGKNIWDRLVLEGANPQKYFENPASAAKQLRRLLVQRKKGIIVPELRDENTYPLYLRKKGGWRLFVSEHD